LLLAAGTVAAFLSLRDDPAWKFDSPPSSYVVVYRNVINGVPQWEVLAAQRPLEGSDLTYRSAERPGPTAVPDAGTISTATGLFTQTAAGVRQVSGRQPGPPTNDLWLAVEMRDAIERGAAVDLHRTRQIAGMKCAVYRFADPPSGPLNRLDPSVGHDDICLAANGLVLSETWTLHGSVVEQRTAQTITVGSWPTGSPRPGATESAATGSPSAAVVTPDPKADSFLAPPPAPAGFRQAMAPVAFRLPDPQHRGDIIASTVVWTFVHNGQVVTVEAGRERGGVLPWADSLSPTRSIRLPGLGTATTALRSDGPEVRVVVGDGHWVRVRGTVALTTLTSYAGTLRLR
jgi:hypothetical protein